MSLLNYGYNTDNINNSGILLMYHVSFKVHMASSFQKEMQSMSLQSIWQVTCHCFSSIKIIQDKATIRPFIICGHYAAYLNQIWPYP